MYDQDDRIGFLIVFVVLLVLVYGIHSYLKEKKKKRDEDGAVETAANQDDDIWNISSRVNQQGPGGTNWPTHDHHLNVDDFVLAPEYTAKDTRPPPPPYAEVDLPSYEQATGCRPPQADLPAVHVADRNVAGPSR